MTEPLLIVDGLQVTYHRTAVALHGVRLRVLPQTIVALLGNNGAGKTTTLRAISGFIGLDDAQVTAGLIRFAGARIENTPPHANTARGIVIVPEREKVFPISPSAKILRSCHRGACPRRTASISKISSINHSPHWPICAPGSPVSSPAASDKCWRSAAPLCASPSC